MSEPTAHDPSGAARWIDYLDWNRSELVAGVLALSPDVQRTSLVPSGWTPIELLSHVLHMEQRWFVWGFLGERVAEPWGDWTRPEPWVSDDSDEVRSGARWAVPEDVTAEQLAARLEDIARRTREILRSTPLSTPAASGGRFTEEPPSLEWICFHVLSEYARHAGHLDIVAELGSGLG